MMDVFFTWDEKPIVFTLDARLKTLDSIGAPMTTAIFWDKLCVKHEIEPGHFESPERLLVAKEVLDSLPHLEWIKPRPATFEEINWVHDEEHIKKVDLSRGESRTVYDVDTSANEFSADAAYLGAGGLIEVVESVETGKTSNGFSFPRPPGHHAEQNRIMGFCLFNHIAIAAEYLIRKYGKKRIAIIDYDVHHGNGTQNSFYARDDVLFCSLHRSFCYPGTGNASETGEGVGKGFTVNTPLSMFSGDGKYQKTFDEFIYPAIDNYKPEFILVSAGFDAHTLDPLGGMHVTKNGFKYMNEKLLELANKHCSSKIVFNLEGGYELKGLREGIESVFEIIV